MNKNEFVDKLKVSVDNKEISEKSDSIDKDVYTCLSIIKDSGKVFRFLLQSSELEDDGKKIDTSRSQNYFYSINHELGEIEYNFRKGKIKERDFLQKVGEVYKKFNLKFEYLTNIIDEIEALSRKENEEEKGKLAKEIEQRIVKEREEEVK